jgi:3'-phosphoadenosine 5'-phosphosulfate sulfotransferase (PAPS reductase)/FAD synthetase
MKEYHILSLSGGKDSTALAFFIKDNMPEIHEKIEYIFCDTECELPETYDYLNKIEVFLGKPITRLKPYKSFEHLMAFYAYFPSPMKRWCTVEMKTKPFRKYIYDMFSKQGEGVVKLYIGIRGDEMQRAGYNKYGDNFIQEQYPFVDNSITHADVMDILEKSGVGLPDYYKWSKRSGCYFCPYQSKITWINLYKNHPDLFFKAKAFEDKKNADKRFKAVGWNLDMRLEDMIKPENMAKIKADYERIQKKKREKQKNKQPSKLINMIGERLFDEEDDNENKCLLCHL